MCASPRAVLDSPALLTPHQTVGLAKSRRFVANRSFVIVCPLARQNVPFRATRSVSRCDRRRKSPLAGGCASGCVGGDRPAHPVRAYTPDFLPPERRQGRFQLRAGSGPCPPSGCDGSSADGDRLALPRALGKAFRGSPRGLVRRNSSRSRRPADGRWVAVVASRQPSREPRDDPSPDRVSRPAAPAQHGAAVPCRTRIAVETGREGSEAVEPRLVNLASGGRQRAPSLRRRATSEVRRSISAVPIGVCLPLGRDLWSLPTVALRAVGGQAGCAFFFRGGFCWHPGREEHPVLVGVVRDRGCRGGPIRTPREDQRRVGTAGVRASLR
jgi:hypothetical protein